MDIRGRRKARSLEIIGVAEATGISLETITRIERDGTCEGFDLRPEQIRKLSQVLQIPVRQLDPSTEKRSVPSQPVQPVKTRVTPTGRPNWHASRRPKVT